MSQSPSRRRPRGGTESPTKGQKLPELDPRLRGLQIEPTDEVTGPTREPAYRRPRRRRLPLLAKATAVFLAVAAVAILLLQLFVFQAYAVPGDAMTPTLQSGDRILVLKRPCSAGSIHKGEIIVFRRAGRPPVTVPETARVIS